MSRLQDQFGNIDIYLFDQLLKGRIEPDHRILDAGCGGGRNLVYLLQHGFDVRAVDSDALAVARTKQLMEELRPDAAPDTARVASLDELPFADDSFDVVICNAVLHFARDHAHFDAMTAELLRVLAPGGLFFCRLASDVGIEEAVEPIGEGRYGLPDRSERYLVNEQRLEALTRSAGAKLLDPIKTTNVQGLRCMTTWVLQAGGD